MARVRPDLADPGFRIVGRGWDTIVGIHGEWVVCFARTAAIAAEVECQVRLLSALGPRLEVAVPVPATVSVSTPYQPGDLWIYRQLTGARLAHGSDHLHLATPLATFLTQLHQLTEASLFPDLVAKPPPWPTRVQRGYDQAMAACTGRLGRSLTAQVERCFAELREHLAADQVPNAILHGDLTPENVFVDGDRLSAVLDWGDSTSGGPAFDFGALWSDWSSALARRAVDQCGGDGNLWRRMLLYARLRRLSELAVAVTNEFRSTGQAMERLRAGFATDL